MTVKMKLCNGSGEIKCGRTLEWNDENFHRKNPKRLSGTCKDCRNKATRSYERKIYEEQFPLDEITGTRLYPCKGYKDIECNRMLPRTNDYFHSNGEKLETSCKDCKNAHDRYKRSQAYLDEESFNKRKISLKKLYDMTPEHYNELLKIQNGVCCICLQEEKLIKSNGRNFLSVDHSHSTGEIRGLLCNTCNVAIGKLETNTESLNPIEKCGRILLYLSNYYNKINEV